MNRKVLNFTETTNDTYKTNPMFLGKDIFVARYDVYKHRILNDLTNLQIGYFWRPNEISLNQDKTDFYYKLTDNERFIFTENLKYQTVLDSCQGRAPNLAYLPLCTSNELERFITAWSFMEVIHSESYTHMLRSVYQDPQLIFDNIISNKPILNRADSVSQYYDELLTLSYAWLTNKHSNLKLLKEALFKSLVATNALESLRFQVCFSCNFAFNEDGKMEGSTKIMRLIARDEILHYVATQHILNIMLNNEDNDLEMNAIAQENLPFITNLYNQVANQEKEWARYIFNNGSLNRLSVTDLEGYIDYLKYRSLDSLGIKQSPVENPIPWINAYFDTHQLQYAPQEVEISNYLSGQITTDFNYNNQDDQELL